MIAIGDEIWVEYAEPPPRLAHKRVIVGISSVNPEHFGVLTPDFDVYIEECDAANTDVRGWWKHWPGAAPPHADVASGGVRRYDFANPPSLAQVAQASALAAAKLPAHDRAELGGAPKSKYYYDL